jgi:plasmid stabilization system protein ParE
MKSGYKLFWTDHALEDLQNILNYLTEKWTQRELRNFAKRLDKRLEIISGNPGLFPKTNRRKDTRRSVLTRHTVIYYAIAGSAITILTLFDSRRNPKKLKL